MRQTLTFILSIFLQVTCCQASFKIYLEDDVFRSLQLERADTYACDLFVRFDADNMNKSTISYAPSRDPKLPVYECTKVPDTILIQLTYDLKGQKTMVENILGYEELEGCWRVKNYNVTTSYNKTSYDLHEEVLLASWPTELRILVKNPLENRLTILQPVPHDLMEFTSSGK